MRKSFIFGLIASLFPCIGFAENPKITRLMREKQNKMEQLEKCMGSTKGLKIAGISTLGLTAVGVAGNIAEASAIKKYDSQIESTEQQIDKTQQEIDEKRKKIEQAEEKAAETRRQERMLKNVALADINAINGGGSIGSRAVSHGYMPEQLPDGLRSQFANAMINFIARCRANIGTNGVKEVSLSPALQENWRQYVGGTPLAEDYLLPNMNEHVIAECKITECNLATHNSIFAGGATRCIEKVSVNNTSGNNGNSGDNSEEQTIPDNNNSGDIPVVEGQVNVGIDCLADVKNTEPHATSAKTNENGVCEVLSCDLSMVPDTNKTTCIEPEKLEEVKNCDGSVLASLHASAGTEESGGCFVKKCETGYHLELNGRKYNVGEFDGVDLNMKCVKNAPVKSAAQITCEGASGTKWENNKCKCTDNTKEWKGNICAIKMEVPVLPNDATKVATKTIIEPLQKTPMVQSQPGKSDLQIACEKVGTFVEYRNLGSTRCTISGVKYHLPKHCDTIPKGRWHPVNSQYCEYDGG